MFTELPTDQIDRRRDARPLNEASVASLMDSIASVGLINPIRVRAAGDRWEVVAGAHRLAACRQLGLVVIECIIVTDDDLHAELSMIDENLCRNELSPAERASQTARRKQIYEELHPETKAGVAGATASNVAQGNATDNLSTASFAEATASATGKDERSVRRDAERGSKVIGEVIDLITGTKLDTGAYLDKLKRLSPNDQVTAAKRDLAVVKSNERDQKARARSAKIDSDVKARAAKEVAEIIAEHVPGEWWDAIKSNLYASGAKNIGDALSNITGESVMDRKFA